MDEMRLLQFLTPRHVHGKRQATESKWNFRSRFDVIARHSSSALWCPPRVWETAACWVSSTGHRPGEQGYAMNAAHADVVREQTRLIEDPKSKRSYWDNDEIKPTGTLMITQSLPTRWPILLQQGDKYLVTVEVWPRTTLSETVNKSHRFRPQNYPSKTKTLWAVPNQKAWRRRERLSVVTRSAYPLLPCLWWRDGGAKPRNARSVWFGRHLCQDRRRTMALDGWW